MLDFAVVVRLEAQSKTDTGAMRRLKRKSFEMEGERTGEAEPAVERVVRRALTLEVSQLQGVIKSAWASMRHNLNVCVKAITTLEEENARLKRQLEIDNQKNSKRQRKVKYLKNDKRTLHAKTEETAGENVFDEIEITADTCEEFPCPEALLAAEEGDEGKEGEEDGRCRMCRLVDPPAATTTSPATHWIGCDCGAWYHLACLDLQPAHQPDEFSCDLVGRRCS